mgnify:CR=1 FL=1
MRVTDEEIAAIAARRNVPTSDSSAEILAMRELRDLCESRVPKLEEIVAAVAAAIERNDQAEWRSPPISYNAERDREIRGELCRLFSRPAAPPRTREERSWPEDSGQENGDYMHRCRTCGHEFVGHKRRSTCRVCDSARASTIEEADSKLREVPPFVWDALGYGQDARGQLRFEDFRRGYREGYANAKPPTTT